MTWIKLFGKMTFQFWLNIMLGNGSANTNNGQGGGNFKAFWILFNNFATDNAAKPLHQFNAHGW